MLCYVSGMLNSRSMKPSGIKWFTKGVEDSELRMKGMAVMGTEQQRRFFGRAPTVFRAHSLIFWGFSWHRALEEVGDPAG